MTVEMRTPFKERHVRQERETCAEKWAKALQANV